MKYTSTIFPGVRKIMAIGYKYDSRKFLGFIATDVTGITELGDPYLCRFPGIYSNVSVHPVVLHHLLVRYFIACNEIYKRNMMRKSDLALDKYWGM